MLGYLISGSFEFAINIIFFLLWKLFKLSLVIFLASELFSGILYLNERKLFSSQTNAVYFVAYRHPATNESNVANADYPYVVESIPEGPMTAPNDDYKRRFYQLSDTPYGLPHISEESSEFSRDEDESLC